MGKSTEIDEKMINCGRSNSRMGSVKQRTSLSHKQSKIIDRIRNVCLLFIIYYFYSRKGIALDKLTAHT
jgi:hypothetical protein